MIKNTLRCCFEAYLKDCIPWRIITFFFMLFLFSVPFAENESFIGIKRFAIASEGMEYYQSIDLLLFQRLNFELLPHGTKALLVNDTIPRECIAVVSGSVEIIDSLPYLLLAITGGGTSKNEEETKKISLKNQPVDAIVDILALKIRHFLEQNITGKLRISSTPLDCEIMLNGVKIGNTPAEMILEHGTYLIQLNREYFFPYKDSSIVLPGRETSLSATMQFKGHRLEPWIISAILFSGGVIIAQLVENKYQKDYTSLKPGEDFDRYFGRYKNANAIKIGLLIPSLTTWTISGYLAIQNKSLERSIFNHD